MPQYILSIDQGTTSSRALLFDQHGRNVCLAQKEFKQFFPESGWVEHDPREIWQSTLEVCREVIAKSDIDVNDIAGIGITNQRETTIIWDRQTGEPVYPAIVWQDRRTAPFCEKIKAEGAEELITSNSGLLIDPYFSATKVRWILENVPGTRERADKGELAFGTVDTYLLWCLTDGAVHATDATNASRTSLFNIHTQQWDPELLSLFGVPESLLPEVKNSSDDFGMTSPKLLGREIPITGVIGDQQAALVGQACFRPGMVKSTYGTGCFLVLNTGSKALRSNNRLLTTVAYRLDGKVCYALEGSIFVAGAAIQWLRDGLHLIAKASETEALAKSVGYDHSVYLVPAFTGLGAPHWDPDARGALFGLTRDTGIAEIVTAGLQSVCFQTKDLLHAMAKDGAEIVGLRVDGGMVVNDWFAQCLADILNVTVDRPAIVETTALGAAYMAGLQTGMFKDLDAVEQLWSLSSRVEPEISAEKADTLHQGWLDAVQRTISRS